MTIRKAATIISGIVQSVPVVDSLDPGTSLTFPSTVTPSIAQTVLAGTGVTAGATLTVQAQQGQAVSGGTNNNGGALKLASGPRGTGGSNGASGQIQLYSGSTLVGHYAYDDPTTDFRFVLGASMPYLVFAANGTGQQLFFQTLGSAGITNFASGTIDFLDGGSALTYRFTNISGGTSSIIVATTVTAFNFTQFDRTTNGATGATFTIQAQNATGTTSIGGALVLQSGSGTSTHGSITMKAGSQSIGAWAATSTPNGFFTVDSAIAGFFFSANATNQTLNFNAIGSGGAVFTSTNAFVFQDATLVEALRITPLSAGTTSISFASTVTASLIRQADLTTASGTGAPLTIQAQNETGTTSVGGTLQLKSGTGTSSNGTINFFSGSTSLCYLGLNGTGVQFTLETGRAGFSIATSTTTQFIQLAAISAGCQIYFDTPTINFRDAAQAQAGTWVLNATGTTSFSFASTITASQILHTIRAGTGANDGADLTIQAQPGQAQTGLADNNDGGDLILQSGAVGTGGAGEGGASDGNVVIKVGANTVGSFTSSIFSMPASYTFQVTTGDLGLAAQDDINIGATGDVIFTTTIFDVNASGQASIDCTDFFVTGSGEAAITGADAVLLESSGSTLTINAASNIIITSSFNIQLFGSTGFGDGTTVISIANADTPPTTNPSGGGILYVEGGALKWLGSGGTITTLGAA